MWVYLAQNDSIAADLLLAKVLDKFPMLAQFPEMGRSRKEFSEELRSFPVKPYIIFYKRMEHHIEIVRILHQFRDIENQF